MDMNDIISDICAAIQSDSTVSTWSLLNYDRACTVFENCDPRNAPGTDDCPLVIVYPLGKSTGLSEPHKSCQIGVACWLHDSQKPESIEGVIRFEGGRNVESLRALVLTALVASLDNDLHIEEVVTDYDMVSDFPLVAAEMALTITQEKLIGVNPYE